ncbi:sulfotransferase [Mesorhizobium comanense]|uniref:sulfotransferase n=1 Tax=Mesorhizobium comanense TaxID=2502215 RepID=UPI0010F44D47|nr:sulfotransferase [Mesorhizobium comanense]
MSTRLPPAWSKHLKVQPARHVEPPKARPVSAPTDDMLLRQALELQQAKRFPEAEELCHRVLARSPNHALALYILGTLGLGFDDELAISFLARAAASEPENPYYQLSLGEACLKVGDYPMAITHLQRACELKPGLIESLCSLAQAYAKCDKADMALAVYERALEINRDHSQARIGMASTLTDLGRMDDAAGVLRMAVAQRVGVAGAYRALVNIRKFSSEPPELQSIMGELGKPTNSADETKNLHQAAGKVLNDLGRYHEALDHFLKAKALADGKFDIDVYRARIDSLIELFNADFLASKAAFGSPSEVPVFVLGMPRSGTTLTEQICSSHPQVHGAGELTKLGRMAASIGLKLGAEQNFKRTAGSMTIQQSFALAEEYLSNLNLYSPKATRIVDKMPHNFELVGLIAVLFPNARIIHCRRDAIDNCLSCFFSNLSPGHSYSYDLATLGLAYREYDRLMRHWQAVLPGRIFENRYEDMVADQEGQSRRLIDHLGLIWDDACLRFYEKAGSVRTISRWQVRQPIYRSSVKRWKNYEGGIQPLIDALGDLAET